MKKLLLILFLPFLLASCADNSNVSSRDILSNVEGGIVLSEKFGLMWQQDRSRLFSTAPAAKEYVNDLDLGGYTDWRMPTKAESHNLFFSLDFGKSDAKKLGMKMGGPIWVQLENEEIIAGEWDAGEACSIVRTFKKTRDGRVRAVRP